MKPSKRNVANQRAAAEREQGRAPVTSKYAAKVRRQTKDLHDA